MTIFHLFSLYTHNIKESVDKTKLMTFIYEKYTKQQKLVSQYYVYSIPGIHFLFFFQHSPQHLSSADEEYNG